MPTDLAPIVDRIRTLVQEPPGESPGRLLARMEHTLTDGYAHALALEGEVLRIERAIGTAVEGGGKPDERDRLRALVDRLAARRGELRRLRDQLEGLRLQIESVRRSASGTG